ncbi:Zinc finger protein CONSTANS-LIKE 5 [Bienertia sinuspersici]
MVVTTEENNIKGLLSGWGLSLTGRPCDTCRAASALLYCRADAAFLCGACDAAIHNHMTGSNTIRHERVWICDVCEQAPAVVTCEADAASLCSTCDHDIHSANPLAHRHRRVPLTPFVDSPINAVAARPAPASSAFLVPDDLDTAVAVPTPPAIVEDDADTWLIPNPNCTFLYNESDLLNYSYNCENIEKLPQFQQYDTKPIVDQTQNHSHSHNSTYAFTDSVVPTQSQGYITDNISNNNSNNNFINHSEASLFENCFNIDFTQPNKQQKKNHSNYDIFSPSSFNYSAQHSVSSSDIGVVPDNTNSNSMSEVSYTFGRSAAVVEGGGATAMDREARVLRYREKRKNRKFQKTIRYASRKAYAETRPRIKGRFAKRTENNETSELDCVDNGYCVVPAF